MALGVGFLNECMNGFEHQVAGHMIREGMILEGMAVERAIHDRYHASKRNPWNELECGDHYSRSMASYGVFLDACGFEYHGPKQHIGFAPKLTPENFRAAFTGSEGWGSYEQRMQNSDFRSQLAVKWGKLRLKSISLAPSFKPATVTVKLGGQPVRASLADGEGKTTVTLAVEITLVAGHSLEINLGK